MSSRPYQASRASSTARSSKPSSLSSLLTSPSLSTSRSSLASGSLHNHQTSQSSITPHSPPTHHSPYFHQISQSSPTHHSPDFDQTSQHSPTHHSPDFDQTSQSSPTSYFSPTHFSSFFHQASRSSPASHSPWQFNSPWTSHCPQTSFFHHGFDASQPAQASQTAFASSTPHASQTSFFHHGFDASQPAQASQTAFASLTPHASQTSFFHHGFDASQPAQASQTAFASSTPHASQTSNIFQTPHASQIPLDSGTPEMPPALEMIHKPRNPLTPSVTSFSTTKTRSLLCDTSTFVDPTCYVALVEGRGSARGEIGIASISLNNPTLIICQVSDSTTYVRTLSKLSYFGPVEIIIPVSGFSTKELKSKLLQEIIDNFPHAKVVEIQRRYFCENKGLQIVKRLCSPEFSSVELLIQHKYYGLAAVTALIKYVENVQHVFYASHSLKVEYHASVDTTMMDVETIRNIELLSCSLSAKSNKSLYGLLNKCCTPGGTRMLRANLFQPPVKQDFINARLDVVNELIAKPGLFHTLQAILSRFSDIDQFLSLCVVLPKKETYNTFEQRLNHIIGLRQALGLIDSLKDALQTAESKILCDFEMQLQEPVYHEIKKQVSLLIHDSARIHKGGGTMKLQRCFAIKSGVNGILDVSRRVYCETVDDLEDMVNHLSKTYSIPMRLSHNATKGYHVQIFTGGKKNLQRVDVKNLPKSFLKVQHSRNVISFTTEEIIQADTRCQENLREIVVMSNSLVQSLLKEIRSSMGCLYKFSEIISTLDLLVSFADVSQRADFVRPDFANALVIQGGRHPILEHIGRVEVVPNDTIATFESNFHILTGANMSGKSTYLKQILLLQIMAQVGCYVPAKYASFRVADTIFSRLGTGDSIEFNASTFTLEMKEMSYILSNVTTKSLVVIDELGRGTSIAEGTSLCWAMSEKLAQTGAYCFLATHFTEITKLENYFCNVTNYHFLTEERTSKETGDSAGLVYTHKLAKGFKEVKNYGIGLAKAIALPAGIMEKAVKIAETLETSNYVLPDVTEEQLGLYNAEKLYRRLFLLSQDESLKGEDLKTALLNLRQRFLPEGDTRVEEN